MTLNEVRDQALNCTLCNISKRRTNVVFGEGNSDSPLVLVGEGPGEEEDRTGRPFVGRAGKMLDQALADNGLSRNDVYICNTLKCRACEWNGDRARNRPPSPEEVANCKQWLVPQLAAIAPKVILCVGAPSAKNLIKPDFRITLERGKYFECEYAKVALATLHPAYVLRQQSATNDGGYSLIVRDVKRAWECAQRLRDKATV
ncbi:MAG TPA: uracil-DNA glycosylase [Fimbriimonadaceae bacterium]|nr:uracil-DNA glycosylase [Fimbriimonadaceae bacterium]